MIVASMSISVLSWGIILRFINISLCYHKRELSGENAVSKNSMIQFDTEKHRVSVSRKSPDTCIYSKMILIFRTISVLPLTYFIKYTSYVLNG